MGIFHNPFKRKPDPEDPIEAINAKYKVFLTVTNQLASNRLLTSLMQEAAEAIIQPILKRKLADAARQDSSDESHREDLCSEINASVLDKVHKVREGEDTKPINNFGAYVAVVSYNKVKEHLGRKNPQRVLFVNRLERALERHPSLSKWPDQDHKGKNWCGFTAWKSQIRSADNRRLRQLRQDTHLFITEVYPKQDIAAVNPAEVLLAVFSWVGQPILWGDLVNIMVRLWNVKETPSVALSEDEPDHSAINNLPANCGLGIYWQAICTLPTNQCQALLLHAYENNRPLPELLEMYADVSLAELALQMGMSIEELAGIWNELPWQDEQIERRMNVARSYPARLRQQAKRRIAAYLEEHEVQ